MCTGMLARVSSEILQHRSDILWQPLTPRYDMK